jgi:hypothetical protein
MTRTTTPSVPRTCGPRAKTSTPILRRENEQLRVQRAKLVALVDHYYGAYRETQNLLERRERELADIRRRLDNKPILLSQ